MRFGVVPSNTIGEDWLSRRRFGLHAILGIEAFGDCELTQVAAGAAGSVPTLVCQQEVVTADALEEVARQHCRGSQASSRDCAFVAKRKKLRFPGLLQDAESKVSTRRTRSAYV